MSTTPTLEISFKEQVNDLCKCFKYFNIFSMRGISQSYRFTNSSIKSATQRRVERTHAINADINAKPIVKGKLKLQPAVISLSFNGEEEKLSSTELSFSSELILEQAAGINDIDTWYQLVGLQKFQLDGNLGVKQLKFENKWKAYYPIDSVDSDGEFIYVHFIESDSWVAFRFNSVSNDTDVIQILSPERSFIITGYDTKFHFSITSDFSDSSNEYSYTSELNERLEGNKFFDLSKLYTEAEEQVESFKHEQEDPYIDPDELAGSELYFLCGSEENLEKMFTLICHAAIPMQLWDKYSELEINVTSSTEDGDGAHIDYDNMRYESSWGEVKGQLPALVQHIENAFDTALSGNTPSGYSWEYNDGPYDRQSGYDKSSIRLTFVVTAPSAHEQIGAKVEIKQFASVFGKKTIAGLLNQKEE